MKRLIVAVILSSFFVVDAFANQSFEPAKSHKQVEVNPSTVVSSGEKSWTQGDNTVVTIKGIRSTDRSDCRMFDIEFTDILNFKILCQGQSMARIIDLKDSKNYMISQRGDFTTITQYAYLIKRAQISRLEQSTLKVPYVKEIIHLKKSESGELAFYFESFKEDEFGRIIQVQQIQAHGLSTEKRKVSSY